jgi:5'-nucleotidase
MTVNTTPLILVTNDDGIASPGLRAACAALDALGELLIVAPGRQQSGMGRSMPSPYEGRITLHTLAANGCRIQGYAVEGSPAQAVQHALVEIARRKPALVVSGINYGENVGAGITVSGTVGAALEGASFDIPALAVSLQTAPEHYMSYSEQVDFGAAAHFLRLFAAHVLAHGLPEAVDLLKIDVPCDATRETPWRWTRLSRQRYFAPVRPVRHKLSDPGPMGFTVHVDLETLEPDSDVHALAVDHVVSVTPIAEDMTACTFASMPKDWIR